MKAKRRANQIVARWIAVLFFFFFSIGGAHPSSLPRLYVVNEASDLVSVVDPSDLSLIAEVPTGSRPHYVTVDPLGRYFYVTVLFTPESDDLVQVFDVGTNAFVTSVITGHHPSHVVSNRAGTRLYVSTEAGNDISVISVPEFKRIGTIKLKGKVPQGLAITPDDQFLLTPNHRSRDVSVVDLSHHTVDLIPLPPGAKPVAIGISDDGRFAFVTDSGLNRVHKIDTAEWKVVASLSVGKGPGEIPVHPTRPFLYIPCTESGDLYKIDLNAWSVAKVIPVGKGPHGIAYGADGRWAYVTLSGEKPEGRVAVIDTETDTVRSSFPVHDTPYGIAVLSGKNQGR